MGLLRTAVVASRVGLAEETRFARRFDGCQVGAMPPFGNLFGIETYMDRELAKEEYIAFNAGTHTDVIAMRFNDYRKIARPVLAEISSPAAAHDVPPSLQI